MKLLPDQQRVKTLLADTITLLCKNGLNYNSEFCIEALIGITVDQNQVFLVNINETIGKDLMKHSNKTRKRKPVHENGSGLVNGDHAFNHSGMSKNKIPRMQHDAVKYNSHTVPIKESELKTSSEKSSDPVTNSKNDSLIPQNSEISPVFPRRDNVSPSNNNSDRTDPKNNNNNEKSDSPSLMQVKQEPESEAIDANDSELAMQLLYGQSDNGEDGSKSDILNVEHQVTGPPVWPEPTLSFSSGLTLPTVIAPSQSAAAASEAGSPQAAEESSGQLAISQMMEPLRRRRSRLVHEGYKYHKNRQGPDPGKTYWRCSNRKCPGRIILYQGKITLRGQHNHPACLSDWPTNKYPEDVHDSIEEVNSDTSTNNILPIVSNHIDNIKNMLQKPFVPKQGSEVSSETLSPNRLQCSPTIIEPMTDEEMTQKFSEGHSPTVYTNTNFTLGPPVFPSQMD